MKSFLLSILIFSFSSTAQNFNNTALNTSDSTLVAFYPFNGNAIDESGNGYNGSVSGAILTTDRFNQSDKAYNFIYNGFSSDRIEVSGTSNFNFSSGGFSISAWVEFSGLATTGNNYPIFSKHICGEQSGYILMLYNDKLTFWLAGSSGYNILSTPDDYTDNNWHQVVAVYDGVTQAIYVDGLLKNSMSFSYNIFNSANWALGGYNGCNGGFNGKVDEIEVFNRALSGSEILDKYNQSANHLVAFYPFNGNAIDESGNGHDGTVVGGVLTNDRFNQQEKSYTFPNLHNNITLENSTNLNLNSGFTLSAWVKYKNINCGIVGKHNCWTPNGFYLGIDNGQFWFLVSNSVWSQVITNEIYVEDKWYMVTGVYDNDSSTIKIYIDGQLKGSAVGIYTNYNTAPITISEASNGCPDGNNPGAIDEVKIYDHPLSAEEILSEYNLSNTDLIAYYPFNGNANDESGNANNPTYIGSGVTLTEDRFGNTNCAYYFDGNTESYIRIPADNFPTADRTISFWFNADQIENHPTPLSYGGDVCNNSVLMTFNKGGYPNAYTILSHCSSNFISAPYSSPPINNWYYFTLTISGVTQKIFINGELQQTENTFSTPTFVAGKSAILGALLFTDGNTVYVDPTAGYFQGKLDDFRFYNTAMTDLEVQNLYNSEANGLVAFFPFNGNADDESMNGNNGINHNGIFNKDRYGTENASMYFNGVDSYVEGINPGNNLPVGNSPRTFSAWIKNYEYNQYGSNIFHYGTAQVAPTNFHFLITDILGLGNGYGYGVVYGNTNLNDSTWHFVTGVYEGGTERITKLYVDGKLDASGTISTEPNTILGTNWRIGRFIEGSSNFNGNIDELKVYDIPFTNQQVWDIYKATTTAPTLLFPGNDSTLINPTMIGLVLDWDSTVTATGYRFLLANDSLFNSVIHDTLVNTSSFNFYDWFSVNIDNLYWKVRTINDGGTGPWSETNRFNIMLTDVEDETQLPTEFALMQNYPNPFNPSTVISYQLPVSSKVTIKVYDILGNEVATLVNEEKPAGSYEVEFQSIVGSHQLASGVYYYQLRAGDYLETKKMILMK